MAWNSIDRLLGREFETLTGVRFRLIAYDPADHSIRLRVGDARSEVVPAGLFFAALWEEAIREL